MWTWKQFIVLGWYKGKGRKKNDPSFWIDWKTYVLSTGNKKIPEKGTIYYLLKYAVSSFESEKCEVIYLNHNSLMQYPKSHMSVVQTPGPH